MLDRDIPALSRLASAAFGEPVMATTQHNFDGVVFLTKGGHFTVSAVELMQNVTKDQRILLIEHKAREARGVRERHGA